MIDLHGLHVDEALEYAKKEFQSALLRNNNVVRFIVGMPSQRDSLIVLF
jgi:hypothetical protein